MKSPTELSLIERDPKLHHLVETGHPEGSTVLTGFPASNAFLHHRAPHERHSIAETGLTEPWNKGKKTGIVPANAFKNGNVPWNKGKELTEYREENANHWKGEAVEYFGLHHWVNRKLGKPTTCEHCGKTGLTKHQINWANKSHKYLRDLSDWLRLCVKCHRIYDNNFKKTL